MVDGYADRLEKQRHLAMSQAWHAGVIAKSAKTPSLSTLLGVSKRGQTPEEMRAVLKGWAAGAQAH